MYVANWPDNRVRALVQAFDLGEAAEETSPSLAETKRVIRQYGKRRCDVEASVDNLTYHLGYAFAANAALNFPSLALTGLLAMPTDPFSSLFDEDTEVPTLMSALWHAIGRPDVLTWCVEMGTWLQFKRIEAVYRKEVLDFKNSDAFKRSGWRAKPVTPDQYYLVGEICRVLGMETPKLVTRGRAFNFIDEHGGNPRFWNEPPQPTHWWS